MYYMRAAPAKAKLQCNDNHLNYGNGVKKIMKHTVFLLIGLFLIASSGCSYLQSDMRSVNRGYDSFLHDDVEGAESKFNAALEKNPNNPYALLNLGVIYERTGRIEQAKEMYRKVIDIEEDNPTYPGRVTEDSVRGESLRSMAINNLIRLESIAPSTT
jgi:tetratricopeptide (TPR) repeat protein